MRQRQILTPSDGEPDRSTFGRDVEIDRDTLVATSDLAGEAYVYVRRNGSWTEQWKIDPHPGAQDDVFDASIDGDTIVLGPGSVGKVEVWVRSGSRWSFQAELVPPHRYDGDYYGRSVAIFGDTIVVGARGIGYGQARQRGHAYVFTRSGSAWTLRATLRAPDGGPGDGFGASVAIQGETIAVAAPGIHANAPGAGAVYVFTGSGSRWRRQAKLTACDGTPNDGMGEIRISGDTIVAGMAHDWPTGTAYVFRRTGGTWRSEARLVPSDGQPADYFGGGIAIDGNSIVACAGGDDDNGRPRGSAYVFRRTGSTWTEWTKIRAENTNHHLCDAAAVQGDTVLFGNYAHEHIGGVFVFEI